VIDLKSVPCADCKGEYHYCQMDFDHVRGEKLGQVPKMGSKKAIKAEAAKCDVICANCHRVRSQKVGKGSARLRPEDLDMVWKQRSTKTPQTVLLHGGQPAPRPWHSQAGTMPDGALAVQHGIARTTVIRYRQTVGIVPYKNRIGRIPRTGVQPRNWHKFLGVMSDREVARRAGVSFANVSLIRNKLGIPVWCAGVSK